MDVFRQSLENDSRYAMNCNTTFNLQVTHKILEVGYHKDAPWIHTPMLLYNYNYGGTHPSALHV